MAQYLHIGNADKFPRKEFSNTIRMCNRSLYTWPPTPYTICIFTRWQLTPVHGLAVQHWCAPVVLSIPSSDTNHTDQLTCVQLWRFLHTSTGNIHLDIEKAHRKYGTQWANNPPSSLSSSSAPSGEPLASFVHLAHITHVGPVVRVSPNELSFGSVESWRAIYGHSNAERTTPIKAPFYEIFGAGFNSPCIGSERDPQRHGAMRKMVSAAFSQRSLLDQERIVSDKIDDFVRIIGEQAGPGSAGANMTKWYEMVSFDILGEMAFGESFHSLEDGTFSSFSSHMCAPP